MRDVNRNFSFVWNAQETHRPHDLSIGKYHLLCQKQESSTAYSTSISRVQVLSDHALFLCSARMDQDGFHCVTKGIVVLCTFVIQPIFPVVKRDYGYVGSFQIRGTQQQFSEKYLFERRFEIQNFRNICCKISCLPASPWIFEHLKNGKIDHFHKSDDTFVTHNMKCGNTDHMRTRFCRRISVLYYFICK